MERVKDSPSLGRLLEQRRLLDNRSNKLLHRVTVHALQSAIMVPGYANPASEQHVSRTVGRMPLLRREEATWEAKNLTNLLENSSHFVYQQV